MYIIYIYKHREIHVFYQTKAHFHCKGFTTNMSRRIRSYLNMMQVQTVHIFQVEINYFKQIDQFISIKNEDTLFTSETPLLKENYCIIGGVNICIPMVSSCWRPHSQKHQVSDNITRGGSQLRISSVAENRNYCYKSHREGICKSESIFCPI